MNTESNDVTPEYRCQSCKEPISPQLDEIGKGWGKCPHCHHNHPQAINMRVGAFALLTIVSILLCFTLVGVVLVPFTGAGAYYFYKKSNKMIEDPEYRIGEPVE